VTREQLS